MQVESERERERARQGADERRKFDESVSNDTGSTMAPVARSRFHIIE